jgi:hypothetical protein
MLTLTSYRYQQTERYQGHNQADQPTTYEQTTPSKPPRTNFDVCSVQSLHTRPSHYVIRSHGS